MCINVGDSDCQSFSDRDTIEDQTWTAAVRAEPVHPHWHIRLVAGLLAADMRPCNVLNATTATLGHATRDSCTAQVVKGCWQLSGAHRGDRDSDRTAGEAAVRDFAAFQAAGITTLDVADHYGPGEELIGDAVLIAARCSVGQ